MFNTVSTQGIEVSEGHQYPEDVFDDPKEAVLYALEAVNVAIRSSLEGKYNQAAVDRAILDLNVALLKERHHANG